MGGQNPGRGGNRHYSIAPYESYTCADGDIIVAAANDKLYAGVCRVIGRPELIDDPRFRHQHDPAPEPGGTQRDPRTRVRGEHAGALDREAPREDVPCGPINSLREALDWAIDMGMEPIFTGSDDYQAVRNPVRIDGAVITEGNARLVSVNTPTRSGRRSTPGVTVPES